jgi:hypothetical protein
MEIEYDCNICFSPAVEPVITICCNGLFCMPCIKSWIGMLPFLIASFSTFIATSPVCPICRNQLLLKDLIKMERFFKKFEKQIAEKESERCPLHKSRNLDYFCVTCKQAVCGDCGVLLPTV